MKGDEEKVRLELYQNDQFHGHSDECKGKHSSSAFVAIIDGAILSKAQCRGKFGGVVGKSFSKRLEAFLVKSLESGVNDPSLLCSLSLQCIITLSLDLI